LLAHFWPDNDRDATRIAAQGMYDGEVIVATEGLEVLLP